MGQPRIGATRFHSSGRYSHDGGAYRRGDGDESVERRSGNIWPLSRSASTISLVRKDTVFGAVYLGNIWPTPKPSVQYRGGADCVCAPRAGLSDIPFRRA